MILHENIYANINRVSKDHEFKIGIAGVPKEGIPRYT